MRRNATADKQLAECFDDVGCLKLPRDTDRQALTAELVNGGFSGGSTDRPALQQLLADVRARRINVIVVYKVDRLTRSLARESERLARTSVQSAEKSLRC
jgi:DNA invertase Pin-like site-specific DNA recombinase